MLGVASLFDAEAYFGSVIVSTFRTAEPANMRKFLAAWLSEQRHDGRWQSAGFVCERVATARRENHRDDQGRSVRSPLGRNLLASLGLGAPLIGKHGELDFAKVKRQTDLSERIHAPRYPFAIDKTAASRGAAHFESRCASCHAGPESDARLYSVSEVGTDPHRAEAFTPEQAKRFNKFFAELETTGYESPKEPPIRSTQKYWAASMASGRVLPVCTTAQCGRCRNC